MCGRYRLTLEPYDLVQKVNLKGKKWVNRENYKKFYNISPAYVMPVVRVDNDTKEPVLHTMR